MRSAIAGVWCVVRVVLSRPGLVFSHIQTFASQVQHTIATNASLQILHPSHEAVIAPSFPIDYPSTRLPLQTAESSPSMPTMHHLQQIYFSVWASPPFNCRNFQSYYVLLLCTCIVRARKASGRRCAYGQWHLHVQPCQIELSRHTFVST